MVVIYLVTDDAVLTVRGRPDRAYREALKLADQGYRVTNKADYDRKRRELQNRQKKQECAS